MASRFPALEPTSWTVTVYSTPKSEELAEASVRLTELLQRIDETCRQAWRIREESERILEQRRQGVWPE